MLLCIQLAMLMVVRSSIEESVANNLRKELESSANVWNRLVEQNAQRLQLGASLLAADFGFRSAVLSGDAQTIESALENNGARIGATVAGFLDNQFALMALANPQEDASLKKTLETLAQSMAADQQPGQMALTNGRLHQYVLVPVRAPLAVGWVIMGFPVDETLAKDMVSLTSTHVLMVQQDGSQRVMRTIHSSLAMQWNFDLTTLTNADKELTINGEAYALLKIPQASIARDVKVILLRASGPARQVFQYMNIALLVITAVGLGLFAVGSVGLTQRLSRPLTSLVADTERLGRGDYSQPIADLGQHDEVGNLARSFDRMRQNIQASQVEIRQLAYWDRLTGLPNRAQFRELLLELLKAPEHQSCVTVLVLDLDRFKHINDVLGYAFGDKVLQAVASRLKDLAEQVNGQVARMGGGQFGLMLRDLDLDHALEVAHKVTAALDAPFTFDGQMVDLRAGMGIARWPEHAGDVDVLLGYAEVAMYTAKRKSAGVQVYDAALDSGSALTLSMLSELRQAISQNELRLFLQPKIDLANHQVIAAEALVRWQHPTRGMVPPMEFIPFAEQTGYIRHLTLWMLEEAARQWQGLQLPGRLLRIAINLSTRDLMDPDFAAKVDALLARHNAPREGFCLEITESAIMDDPQRAEITLNQLSDSGYKLSIDDFGTGYSSLAYLKRLPVNELKIDKSFVMGMENDESDAQIVRSTIDLAHNLGLSVVAEGVENAVVYKLLAELNCDEGQGYYMSKPLPCTEFNAWRDRWIAQKI
ncbi:MAG: EAL domain-containing protein [Rhodoferax sp.]|nr:EAL domain-containing protein [Rhodoferax sp.]